METQPPEYLPMPKGLTFRATDLVLTGEAKSPDEAYWMAACEAIGAVGRSDTNHRDLFWHGDVPEEQRDAWDRIADREGQRFYFHQSKDTLVGYLAYGRHNARLNADIDRRQVEKLRAERSERAEQIDAATGDITDLARRDARARLHSLYSGQIPAAAADDIADAALACALEEIARLRAKLTTADVVEYPTPSAGEPLCVRWDHLVTTEPGKDTIVACLTEDGGQPVALLLNDELREALGLALVDPDAEMDHAESRVWRADHNGIHLGTFTNAEAAQACCTSHREQHYDALIDREVLVWQFDEQHEFGDVPIELWLSTGDEHRQLSYAAVPVLVRADYDADGES